MENRFKDITADSIRERVAGLQVVNDQDMFKKCFSFLDLTSLNATDNNSIIDSICQKVNNFAFTYPDLPNLAAVCVFPNFVPRLKKNLNAPGIKIASVAASFPSSQTFTDIKLAECTRAIEEGADEIDIVISLGEFLGRNTGFVSDEISAIKRSIGEKHLKVIIESGLLVEPGLIYEASMIAMASGADFIKTSTGKAAVAATPEAAWVMCNAIKDYYGSTGKKIGFKPAGGVSESTDASIYFTIVKLILGDDWLVPDLFRIGASRLANKLLSVLVEQETNYF